MRSAVAAAAAAEPCAPPRTGMLACGLAVLLRSHTQMANRLQFSYRRSSVELHLIACSFDPLHFILPSRQKDRHPLHVPPSSSSPNALAAAALEPRQAA